MPYAIILDGRCNRVQPTILTFCKSRSDAEIVVANLGGHNTDKRDKFLVRPRVFEYFNKLTNCECHNCLNKLYVKIEKMEFGQAFPTDEDLLDEAMFEKIFKH